MSEQVQPTPPAVRMFPDGRLTAKDAAAYLGKSSRSLAIMRCIGDGPRFIKLGKAVFYAKADLDTWVESLTCRSTAEYRAKRRAEPGDFGVRS